MIMLTKEQLADLLREAYAYGAADQACMPENWTGTEDFLDVRERAVGRIVHRSSGGHDDHGREVK